MIKNRQSSSYPAELRELCVRLFRAERSEYTSDNAAYLSIAPI